VDKDTRNSLLAGIHLTQALASSGVSPFQKAGLTNNEFDSSAFYSLFISALNLEDSKVVAPCAECLGFVLNFLSNSEDVDLVTDSADLESLCLEYIDSIFISARDYKFLIVILNRLSTNYPRYYLNCRNCDVMSFVCCVAS
jgi:hypothetical protein